MTIVLYNSTAETDMLDKSGYLTQVSTLTGNLRSGTDLVDPEIVVELDTLPSFNYVYIMEFNRYYFVTDIGSMANRLWSIKLHCDVLYSHRAQILELECEIDRNEFDYDLLLKDEERINEVKYDLEIDELEHNEFAFELPKTTNEFITGVNVILETLYTDYVIE